MVIYITSMFLSNGIFRSQNRERLPLLGIYSCACTNLLLKIYCFLVGQVAAKFKDVLRIYRLNLRTLILSPKIRRLLTSLMFNTHFSHVMHGTQCRYFVNNVFVTLQLRSVSSFLTEGTRPARNLTLLTNSFSFALPRASLWKSWLTTYMTSNLTT